MYLCLPMDIKSSFQPDIEGPSKTSQLTTDQNAVFNWRPDCCIVFAHGYQVSSFRPDIQGPGQPQNTAKIRSPPSFGDLTFASSSPLDVRSQVLGLTSKALANPGTHQRSGLLLHLEALSKHPLCPSLKF